MAGTCTLMVAEKAVDPLLVKGAAAFVQLTFFRYEGDSMLRGTSVDIGPEGTFTVRRLEPGTYKIGIEHFNGGNDLLEGAFLDTNTPISLDLSADKSGFDIELSDYATRKNR